MWIRNISSVIAFVLLPSCSAAPAPGAPVPERAVETAQSPESVQPEDAPDGMKFLAVADTPAELASATKATIAWQDDDGAQLFLWIEEPVGPAARSPFRINRAYLVRQSGKVFWAFLDSSSSEGLRFDSPVQQFLLQRHVLDPFDTDGDGNHSSWMQLARREDGAAVFKIVYASLPGPRSQQELMRAYLLYRAPGGMWSIATRDLAFWAEGSSKMGWWGMSRTSDMRIVWTTDASAPFRVESTLRTLVFEAREGTTPPYTTEKRSVLSGPFPMRSLDTSDRQELVPTGDYTLRRLARTLMEYHSDWLHDAAPEIRRQAEALWIEALQRVNPGVGVDEKLARDRRVVVPNEFEVSADIARRLQVTP